MQWHQLDHMQTICTSLQADYHTDTSSLNFYRPVALPDAQPTVSKHLKKETEQTKKFGAVQARIATKATLSPRTNSWFT